MEPPETLHGQLQRGRGLGYRRALTDPDAGEFVYDCVRNDPRHDRQVESRGWYLSRLVTALRLPVAPIALHLHESAGDGRSVDLACAVLVDLAVRGDGGALAALRAYPAHGPHRRWVLDTMREAGLLGDDAAPSRGRSGRAGAGPSDPPSWTDAQLADQVRATRSRTALVELGRRRSPLVLDLAEEPALRTGPGVLPGLGPALRTLGAAALPRARGWLTGGDPFLADHAADILADHGDAGDIPALLDALTGAAGRGGWCTAEAPARGLGRLAATAAAPVLRRLWAETTHSYARTAFLAGIVGTAPAAVAAAYLQEARDDCEPGVRDLAAARSRR